MCMLYFVLMSGKTSDTIHFKLLAVKARKQVTKMPVVGWLCIYAVQEVVAPHSTVFL